MNEAIIKAQTEIAIEGAIKTLTQAVARAEAAGKDGAVAEWLVGVVQYDTLTSGIMFALSSLREAQKAQAGGYLPSR